MTVSALVDEATKKSGMIWVRVPEGDGRAHGLWHLWQDGAAYVLTGPDEQQLAGLKAATTAEVTVRSKDKQSRLVVWEASVERVEPDTDGWRSVIPNLLGKRLNLPDGEAAAERWAQRCQLHKLTPVRVLEDPDNRDTDAGTAQPAPTPASTRVPRPFHFGRLRRRDL